MTTAGNLLRSARHDRGVSGRELARRAQASQPGLSDVENGHKDATTERLERLLSPLGYQLATLPTRLGTAASAADAARRFLALNDDDATQRVIWQLAADLAAANPALRVALTITPPAPTGHKNVDALIAGVVDHLLATDALPRPPWLDDPSRFLDEPWDVEAVPALRDAARTATPPEIAAHGVYVDAAELVDI